MKIASPLKWHGGKNYLAKRHWEIAKKVDHIHRVEPYCGGASFTLAANPEGFSEVINDIHGELHNFWAVMIHDQWFQDFKRMCEATPFSRTIWDSTYTLDPFKISNVARAWLFFVKCRQSMAGRMEDFAPLSKNRIRRKMNEQASAWITSVDGLQPVHERLRRVINENVPAVKLIKREDGRRTLYYCDPTYLKETRTAEDVYEHEMSFSDHEELLKCLSGIEGKFMLCGYDSELYRKYERASGWRRHEFDLPNNAASGESKRRMTEIVWTNF